MKTAIERLGKEAIQRTVLNHANEIGLPPSLHIEYVSAACCDNLDLAPSIKRKRARNNPDLAVRAWVEKFARGYANRASKRNSNPPGTCADPAIETILHVAIPGLDNPPRVIWAHRLAMSAENILGAFLEEYLFKNLSAHGWAMAWGETIKHVDLCSERGELLQIKNRDNSENSSSSAVRTGTEIKKWFRICSRTTETMWPLLCRQTGLQEGTMSEQSFLAFIQETLKLNPRAFAREPDNPWIAG